MRYALAAVLLAAVLLGCAGQQPIEIGDEPGEDIIGDNEIDDRETTEPWDNATDDMIDEPPLTDAPGEDQIGDNEIADPEDGPY